MKIGEGGAHLQSVHSAERSRHPLPTKGEEFREIHLTVVLGNGGSPPK